MAQNGIAFLMVYVDDFKMVSHRNDTKQLWDPIRKHITMAEPAPSERFLGCYNRRFSAPISAFGELMGNLPSQWSRLDASGVKRTKAEPWQPADPGKVVIDFEYQMTSYAIMRSPMGLRVARPASAIGQIHLGEPSVTAVQFIRCGHFDSDAA